MWYGRGFCCECVWFIAMGFMSCRDNLVWESHNRFRKKKLKTKNM